MSRHTGIPASTLSKVEHDRSTLTYDKLVRLSQCLDVRVSEFFVNQSGIDERTVTARRSIGALDSAVRVNTKNCDYFYLCPELRHKRVTPVLMQVRAESAGASGDLIRHTGWKATWSSLVPIRTSGTKPPFYFVHAIGGNVLNFASFAGHFDPDQPVYGLQARGLDGKDIPNMSIQQMAADYLQDIRKIQPEGPYCIGGFSAGGVVAFEMARQLRTRLRTQSRSKTIYYSCFSFP